MTVECDRGRRRREPLLTDLAVRYLGALLAQAGQNAGCNRMHDIDQRAAKWLLLCRDRVKEDTFELTQELLAIMLGVTRPRLNAVQATFARAGFISYSRGRVSVLDRAALEDQACDCYGVIARELAALAALDQGVRSLCEIAMLPQSPELGRGGPAAAPSVHAGPMMPVVATFAERPRAWASAKQLQKRFGLPAADIGVGTAAAYGEPHDGHALLVAWVPEETAQTARAIVVAAGGALQPQPWTARRTGSEPWSMTGRSTELAPPRDGDR